MPPWQHWDETSLKRLIRSVLHTERAARVSPGSQGYGVPTDETWHPFKNDYSGTIPGYGVIEVEALTAVDGGQVTYYSATRPGLEYGKRYAVNSPQPVTAGGAGLCRFFGPCTIAYESGAEPVIEEGWGIKPNQFTLAKGYPCTTIVDGIVYSAGRLLKGSFDQPSVALIRFTGSVSNNTSTTSYKIYAGTMGSESDAGFTTVPSARNRTGARVNNDWAVLHRINDGWEIVNLEDAASDAEIFRVTLSGGVTDGGTISITSPVAGSVTAHNEVNGAALLGGDVVTAYKDKGDATYQLLKTQAGTATEIYNITIPSPGVASLASISVTIPSGTVSATNWSDTTMAAEDYAHVYKNPDDGLYYLFKTGGSGTDYGIIEGLVASPFTKTTYQFLVSVILDDKGTYSAGTLITVQNLYKATTGQYLFEGEGGAMCQFRYSPSAGTFRAIWVECPASDGVQVGLVTEGNQGINLGGYGYGGQADIVSNIYYGV